MNANDVFTFIVGGFFISLGVVTAADFVHHRDKMRRDVALMVWSIALLFLLAIVVRISGVPSPRWLTLIATIGLIAQPYLLLRIVHYFRHPPARLMRGALISMVTFWVATLVFSPAPPLISLLLVAYFVVVDGYAMLAFVRGALNTSGTVRQRLRFAAAGSGLLAVTLLIAGLGAVIPAVVSITSLLAVVALVASGIAYYIGFAPPRWLRRSWQFAELNRYLADISSAPTSRWLDIGSSLISLSRAASQGVGGMGAGIAQRDENDQRWLLRYEVGEPGAVKLDREDIITQAWTQDAPRYASFSADTSANDRALLESVGADTVLVVPFHVSELQRKLLLVFLKHGSLFIDDDVNLVSLLVKQSAVVLQNGALLEQVRRQEDEKRMAVEARLNRMLDTMAEAVISIDSSQTIIRFNQSAEHIFGYSAEETLGQPLDMLLPPDVISRHAKYITDFATGSDITRGMGERHRALSARRKDGTIFPIEASISRLTENERVILTVFLRDVTERHEAAAALRASEGRYQHTLDNMLEGCQIISFDWRYVYVNESAARYGRTTREDLLGSTVMEKYPGIEASEMYAMMKQCMDDRTTRLEEFEFQYPDGSVAWFEFSIQPVPEGIFILSLDITERKEAERALQRLNEELEKRVNERTKQLQASNKELEAFTYSVSHDLRAPLRGIDGFSRALEEELADIVTPDGKRYIDRIRGASQRMGQLIDDLLDLSRLTRSEIRREQINLSEMAQQIAAELREQYPNQTVDFKVEDGLVTNGDARLMQVVMGNLLSNAWKYTSKQPQPQIEFGSADQNGRRTYFVRDNGVGFDMSYSDKLFGVFQRLHGANEFPGNGIGLATVQRIIHRHGGEIWADAAVNMGATFYFSL
ncbi:MAG: PAS domain S-box protein [Anaerolineae bacterium]|nr:PAS domain S-box protein [Anaerolineae bacterium]